MVTRKKSKKKKTGTRKATAARKRRAGSTAKGPKKKAAAKAKSNKTASKKTAVSKKTATKSAASKKTASKSAASKKTATRKVSGRASSTEHAAESTSRSVAARTAGATESTLTRRLSVPKTFKMFVGGAFIRSEGGKVLEQSDHKGTFMAHYCRATRKDLRDAVTVARKAQSGWAARSEFNRSQILYRLAEMMEDRRAVFVDRMMTLLGDEREAANIEVDIAIDRVFWYAGWTDKFAQVLGGVNPVASPHFNFTLPDACGVVGIMPSKKSPFLGLISAILPIVLTGNTCVVIADGDAPVLASDLGEAIATSDFPAGVINILTGKRDEVLRPIAEHMDVNAVAAFGAGDAERELLQSAAADNVKRVRVFKDLSRAAWQTAAGESLYWIEPFVEWKTAWHPVGV